MAKETNLNSKLPAFMAMLHEDKKRIQDMEAILNAPDFMLSESEKEEKAEQLLIRYEKEAEKAEKWNNFVQLDCKGFEDVIFNILENSPNPKRTLVIFNLLIGSIDRKGKSLYNAQSLAKKIKCHVNNVYPSLKWLRENNIIVDKKEGTKKDGIYIM